MSRREIFPASKPWMLANDVGQIASFHPARSRVVLREFEHHGRDLLLAWESQVHDDNHDTRLDRPPPDHNLNS